MLPDEAKVLQLLNAGTSGDENFAPMVRLRALTIALETAIEIQTTFARPRAF